MDGREEGSRDLEYKKVKEEKVKKKRQRAQGKKKQTKKLLRMVQ